MGMGSIGNKSTISEYDPVAYQIKENHECCYMVANLFSTDPHDPRDGVSRSKIQHFQKMVMLYIKLKRIANAATW